MFHGNKERLTIKMGSATCNDSIETTKHGNGSKGIQGYDHLAWDSTREKNGSKKKTEQQSSGSSQLRNGTEANKRSNRKEAKQHGKHTSINMAYDAQTSMMHVRFKYAWHGNVHKQNYKLSGAQYATSCILTKHHMLFI